MSAFEEEYFTGYSHDGSGDYSQVYKNYTVDPIELRTWLDRTGRWPNSFLDLGAATGVLMNDFQAALNFDTIEGIEISKWAVANRVNPHVRRGNILNALSILKGRRFDLVFGNALMYLNEVRLAQHLAELPHMLADGGVFILCTLDSPNGIELPYAGNGLYTGWTAAPVFARTKKWWHARMIRAGFKPVGQMAMASLWARTNDPCWESFGNPLLAAAAVRAEYPKGRRWRGKKNPLRLVAPGCTSDFIHDEDRWLECARKSTGSDDERLAGLGAMMLYFHTGIEGTQYVQLIGQNWYDHIPFARHIVEDGWFTPVSDEEYQ